MNPEMMEAFPRTRDQKYIKTLDSDLPSPSWVTEEKAEVKSREEAGVRTVLCCVTKVMEGNLKKEYSVCQCGGHTSTQRAWDMHCLSS